MLCFLSRVCFLRRFLGLSIVRQLASLTTCTLHTYNILPTSKRAHLNLFCLSGPQRNGNGATSSFRWSPNSLLVFRICSIWKQVCMLKTIRSPSSYYPPSNHMLVFGEQNRITYGPKWHEKLFKLRFSSAISAARSLRYATLGTGTRQFDGGCGLSLFSKHPDGSDLSSLPKQYPNSGQVWRNDFLVALWRFIHLWVSYKEMLPQVKLVPSDVCRCRSHLGLLNVWWNEWQVHVKLFLCRCWLCCGIPFFVDDSWTSASSLA